MDITYILYGIITVIALFAVYYIIKQKQKQRTVEGFSGYPDPQIDIISKPIDLISVVLDPIINPSRVVVVITKDRYLWKYEIINKKMDDMTLEDKRFAALKPIPGYPKLIGEEWNFLPEYFQTDLKGIYTKMNTTYFIKNRFQISINAKTGKSSINMVHAGIFKPNQSENINLNEGFDSVNSNTDCIFPGDQETYIKNIYPKLNTDNYIDNSNYKCAIAFNKDYSSYIVKIENSSGDKTYNWNSGNIKLVPQTKYFDDNRPNVLSYYSDERLHNLLNIPHMSLGDNIYNSIFLNDLYSIRLGRHTPKKIESIDRSYLWHQLRRNPRCAYTYPLVSSRQSPSYIYVFGTDKVWKYTPTEQHDDIKTIMTLVHGYPKMIEIEYPGLPSIFTDNLDGVWCIQDDLFFVKGNNVVKYNKISKTAGNSFQLNTIFQDIDDKYIEAIVQTQENDDKYIYLYNNGKYLKYKIGLYSYNKETDWTAEPNAPTDFLMLGWYHPIINSKILSYETQTYFNNTQYNNEDLYHAYSKNIYFNEPGKGFLMIQQTILGKIKGLGFKQENGKLSRIQANDFDFQQYWKPIIEKAIPDMCGIINIDKYNGMRYVFAQSKFYSFVSTGPYNNSNYIMNLFGNSYSNTDSPANFNEQKLIVPHNFDYCFYDNEQYAWFFKNGMVYKFDVTNKNIVDYKNASDFFQNLNPATEAVFYDTENKKLYFIRGNIYTIYNYNHTSSNLVQDESSLFGLFDDIVAKSVSQEFKSFAPTSQSFSKVFNISESALNINSLHNLISNGDFMDMNLDNLGNIKVIPEIVSTEDVIADLPYYGRAVKFVVNEAEIMNITLPELYVSDIVFSFYVKKDINTAPFEIEVSTESKDITITKVQVQNNWNRVVIYQWQDYNYPFKIRIKTLKTADKQFYISGLQLENNLIALPFFSGRVFHTWDEINPPEIGYLYNLNYLSTIPPQTGQLDIADLMSYNTINQERTPDDIGFKKEQAIYFDGKKVFMVIPTTAIKPTTVANFSISIWIRFRKFSEKGSYQSLWGISTDKYSFLVQETTGKIEVKITQLGGIAWGYQYTTIVLNPQKWYFIALTVYDNKLRLYAYNYYEDANIDVKLLPMVIDSKILIGLPADYNNMIYKKHALNADIGSISVWRRNLLPNDIKILSRTFKDVKLALPEVKRKQLIGSGLPLLPLFMEVFSVDGLGMCTYNAHIKWTTPKISMDYMKLGINIVQYEAKFEYYVGNNLIPTENLEPYIQSEKITKDVKNIKFILPDIQCSKCEMSIINVPYEYNYRLYVKYILSNGESSPWAEMDLRYKDDLVPRFGITAATTCKYKQYAIDPVDKIKGEQIQNKFLEYAKNKLTGLQPN